MKTADLGTNKGDDCPSGWTKVTTLIAACITANSEAVCYFVIFTTLSVPFGKVEYQWVIINTTSMNLLHLISPHSQSVDHIIDESIFI